MADEPEVIKIRIEWSVRELFTAEREINKAEFLEWAGNPALEEVSSATFTEYLKSGRTPPEQEYELEAMAEGVSWHDRVDFEIDGVTLS